MRAASRSNHPARSTSGNSPVRPDRGGHSIANVLLCTSLTSTSPSHRPGASRPSRSACRSSPSEHGASRRNQRVRGTSSSRNSRDAACERDLARQRTRPWARTTRRRVFLRPIGATGMHEQHLDLITRSSVQEESRTALGHRRLLSPRRASKVVRTARSCRPRRGTCRAGSLSRRAKRRATPPGYLGTRCTPSKATSTTSSGPHVHDVPLATASRHAPDSRFARRASRRSSP